MSMILTDSSDSFRISLLISLMKEGTGKSKLLSRK